MRERKLHKTSLMACRPHTVNSENEHEYVIQLELRWSKIQTSLSKARAREEREKNNTFLQSTS